MNPGKGSACLLNEGCYFCCRFGVVWVWSAPKLFELEVSFLCQGWWLYLKRVSERKLGSYAGIVLVILNSLIDDCLSSPS